ncbi:MAG: hypothetical protein EOP67_36505 [Sphingomonas sp.]|nr:MAG: hypothetical protein EOP67_36505 [Sphingomonas sp.]
MTISIALGPFALDRDPSVMAYGIPCVGRSAATCDFSGDGRLSGDAAVLRSAWKCPGFYLAVPTCALLMTSVAVIRIFRIISMPFTAKASRAVGIVRPDGGSGGDAGVLGHQEPRAI